MAGHSFPVSIGLPRWRPCQNPYPGEATLSQFPVGSSPPPPWGLTLIGALPRVKNDFCLKWVRMAFKLVILASLVLFCILLVLFLSFTVYIAYIHWIYRHIPGPARDSFFSGNRPFFVKEKKLRGKSLGEIYFDLYRKYGPVFVVWVDHIPVVHLSDPQMVKKCLATLNLPKAARVYSLIGYVYGTRFAGSGILTEVDHEVWQRKRSTLNPAFHRKYLINLMGAFNTSCNAFVKKLREMADGKTEVRMLDEFARVTLDVIGKVM